MPWTQINVDLSAGSAPGGIWNTAAIGSSFTGEAVADLIDTDSAATGVSFWVTTAFGSILAGTWVDQAHYDIPEGVWDSVGLVGSTVTGTVEFRGLAASTQYTFDFFGTSLNSRTRDATTNDGTWNNPAPLVQTAPSTPSPPTEGTFTTDGSGTGSIAFSSADHATAVPIAGVRLYAASASGPTPPYVSVSIS